MKTQSCSGALGCAFFFATIISAFGQGSIFPTTAPTLPIMKTLDQVEPRVPLAGGTTTVSIAASGSYYLTGNITISSTGLSGIIVSSSVTNVTIDLNGFTLTGPSSGSSGSGVFLGGGVANVTIVNGTIRNWGSHGIDAVGNADVRVEKLRLISNGGAGISAGVNCIAIDCAAESNAGKGLEVTDQCLIKDCQAIGNVAGGISMGTRGLVTGCVVYGNGNGITGAGNCLILSNNCSDNGTGIIASGQGNRIEANNVITATPLQTNIKVTGDKNFIIRNTARGGSPNYDIAVNNKVGFIVIAPDSAAISGSTGGSGVGTSDPWANFSF